VARTGRRPGSSGAREAILDAARKAFAGNGYDATSLRGVARDAGVDPALVHHYFGSKAGMFAAATSVPVDLPKALESAAGGDPEELGERLVTLFLSVWDNTPDRSPLLALIRGAASHEDSARLLREFLTTEVLGRVVALLEVPHPQLRANLVGSQMVGLAMARYVVRLEPLASAERSVVVAAVGPIIQRYLTGDIGAVSS